MKLASVGLTAMLLTSVVDTRALYADERVVVSAAASLRDVLAEIGAAYEWKHRGTELAFNFSNSGQLTAQIELGAPVDIFVSADIKDIDRLASRQLVRAQATFARNALIVAVSNRASPSIQSIGDLAANGVHLIAAARQVPIAAYTREFLDKVDRAAVYGPGFGERFRANVMSEEQDVRTLATKIAMGEGDAGIIYVTDVTRDLASKVRTIVIPEDLNVTAAYGVALLLAGADRAPSRSFYEYLQSQAAAVFLRKHGFMPP